MVNFGEPTVAKRSPDRLEVSVAGAPEALTS